MASGKAIWELSAFRSLFADPFAEGNELEAPSHAAESFLVLSHVLSLQLQTRPEWMNDHQYSELQQIQKLVKECFEHTAAAMEAQDPTTFNKVLVQLMQLVENIPPSGKLMLPGGWRGTL
jgi:hypothetical protein